MTIREAKVNDFEDICLLNKYEMGYEYPQKDTKTQLENLLNNRNHKIYVAIIDDMVVGYVHANDYNLLFAPPMKNIMGIAVSKEYKRKGKCEKSALKRSLSYYFKH